MSQKQLVSRAKPALLVADVNAALSAQHGLDIDRLSFKDAMDALRPIVAESKDAAKLPVDEKDPNFDKAYTFYKGKFVSYVLAAAYHLNKEPEKLEFVKFGGEIFEYQKTLSGKHKLLYDQLYLPIEQAVTAFSANRSKEQAAWMAVSRGVLATASDVKDTVKRLSEEVKKIIADDDYSKDPMPASDFVRDLIYLYWRGGKTAYTQTIEPALTTPVLKTPYREKQRELIQAFGKRSFDTFNDWVDHAAKLDHDVELFLAPNNSMPALVRATSPKPHARPVLLAPAAKSPKANVPSAAVAPKSPTPPPVQPVVVPPKPPTPPPSLPPVVVQAAPSQPSPSSVALPPVVVQAASPPSSVVPSPAAAPAVSPPSSVAQPPGAHAAEAGKQIDELKFLLATVEDMIDDLHNFLDKSKAYNNAVDAEKEFLSEFESVEEQAAAYEQERAEWMTKIQALYALDSTVDLPKATQFSDDIKAQWNRIPNERTYATTILAGIIGNEEAHILAEAKQLDREVANDQADANKLNKDPTFMTADELDAEIADCTKLRQRIEPTREAAEILANRVSLLESRAATSALLDKTAALNAVTNLKQTVFDLRDAAQAVADQVEQYGDQLGIDWRAIRGASEYPPINIRDLDEAWMHLFDRARCMASTNLRNSSKATDPFSIEFSVATDVEKIVNAVDKLKISNKFDDLKDMGRFYVAAERLVRQVCDELGMVPPKPNSQAERKLLFVATAGRYYSTIMREAMSYDECRAWTLLQTLVHRYVDPATSKVRSSGNDVFTQARHSRVLRHRHRKPPLNDQREHRIVIEDAF